MAKEEYYEVLPKVVPADEETTITIRPLYEHCQFNKNADYKVTYIPLGHVSQQEKEKITNDLKLEDGYLHIRQFFAGEQEHILNIVEVCDEKENENKKEIEIGDFHFYSLKEDLLERTAYKGDIHMHSCHSDAVEAPAYVAASCRKMGFDFMALTDHRRYYPSQLAQEAYQSVPIDLKIFRGEEVHPPENPVHIINFGGEFGISEIFENDEEIYKREVENIAASLNNIDDDIKDVYASCIWAFDKIREAGGLAIFSHPYWKNEKHYYIAEKLTTCLLENRPFDALEVINGSISVESNQLQAARYHEERQKGGIPVVAVSDAHGCLDNERFGAGYTVVFSSSLKFDDVISNIKGNYSVGVENLPGNAARVHGPFRLVRYTYFLLREVFPHHDKLCQQEGEQMLQYISGDGKARQRLEQQQGQVSNLREKIWNR